MHHLQDTFAAFLSLHLDIATEDIEFQVNNSNFEIFSKEKNLKFLAASASSSEKNHGTLFFNDISLIISNTDDFDRFVKSDKAQYIRKKNIIHLEKNVLLEIMNEQHPFNLKTDWMDNAGKPIYEVLQSDTIPEHISSEINPIDCHECRYLDIVQKNKW